MNLTSKIYVAGHRGLVGSAILRKLRERGFQNLSFRTSHDLDLRRQKDTEAFFERERPEFVFLAAAKVGGILANATYQAEFIYDNVAIAANIIHSAYQYGVKKLLNLGSSCIYPKFSPQPMKEDYLLTGSLEPTNEPYAIAKIAAIKLCRYYNEQYGTNYMSIMPTNLYGPNDNFNLEIAHVLPALVRKFHLARLMKEKRYDEVRKDIQILSTGFDLDHSTTPSSAPQNRVKGALIINPEQAAAFMPESRRVDLNVDLNLAKLGITPEAVTLWGTGEPYREFLYVDDLADACVFLMENHNAKDLGEFVNIGNGKDIKIKELAPLIKEIIGFEGEIRYDSSKPDGTPRKLLDISRMTSLGWAPKTSLEEGVRKTYEWYKRMMKSEVE